MPYGRSSYRRRSTFRSSRLRRRRPTSYRKRPSYWKRRVARYNKKLWLNPNTSRTQLVKFTWADQYLFDAAGFTYAAREVRLNSLYDPDLTGVGGTPSAVNKYADLYKNYQVMAAKVECRVWNTGAIPCIFGFTAQSDDFTVPSTGRAWQQLFIEQGNGKSILVNPTTYGDKTVGYLRWFGKIKSLMGGRWGPDCVANFGGNPAKCPRAILAVVAPDGATVGAKVNAIIKITYYSKLRGQNPAAQAD